MFVVLRLSLPGSYIPATATSPPQNPVLVLNAGFQVTLDYRSPNGTWYPYSYLQGNNATITWISQNLYLTTNFSQYGYSPPTVTSPTILSSGVPTAWSVTTLSQAPMFAKADPRSIRYNSQIGVLKLGATASPTPGIIGSTWPNGYATPPPLTPGLAPAPTPTPIPTATPSVTPSPTPSATPNFPNPATLGDNVFAGNAGNPYNESNGKGAVWRPVMMNRPFRSVGEMGYAFRDQPFKTLDFSSANSPDAGLLDLFSVNDYSDPSSMRAGVINLNSHQGPALAAVLGSTIKREDTPRVTVSPSPSPIPQVVTNSEANNTAATLASNSAPVINKVGLATLIAPKLNPSPSPSLLDSSVPKTQRESIVRALGEAGQTRTWNLMIDVIAQGGRYPPTATTAADLPNFIVEGEQRYWVHVAIDRFTGQVIDKQIEVVNE